MMTMDGCMYDRKLWGWDFMMLMRLMTNEKMDGYGEHDGHGEDLTGRPPATILLLADDTLILLFSGMTYVCVVSGRVHGQGKRKSISLAGLKVPARKGAEQTSG